MKYYETNGDRLNINKDKIIIITGPTAIGKSELGIDVATRFDGEIVSADSMQIYRSMNIGTGKVMDYKGIKHHMLDIVDYKEEFSVQQYVTQAKKIISDIVKRNNLPIIVGGTGLYITSLVNNSTFAQIPKNEKIRTELLGIYEQFGANHLHQMLEKIDESSSRKIAINDVKRTIRALEIYMLTGKPKSQFIDDSQPVYDYLLFVLSEDRQALYEKIESRVDKMLELGLVDEVISLITPDPEALDNLQSMQAIGYKEVISFLKNQITYDEMVYRLKLNTRHYAKRQMTYFKNMPLEKTLIDIQNLQEMYNLIQYFVNN